MLPTIGDRMKRHYEDRCRILMPRRTFTILRVDGKSFHTYTRQCEKPHDPRIVAAMAHCALPKDHPGPHGWQAGVEAWRRRQEAN